MNSRYLSIFLLSIMLVFVAKHKQKEAPASNNHLAELETTKQELANLKHQKELLEAQIKEIYTPFNKFINNPFAMHNWQKKEYLDTIVEDKESEIKLKSGIKIKNFCYRPLNCSTNSKLYLFSLHGTMSSWNVFGNSTTASSKAIRELAKELAYIYNQPVELLVVNWGGELSQKRRIKVGSLLAEYVSQKHSNANDKIWAIGHSHGCNVINNMAEELRNHKLSLDCALLIAPIALDINPCCPTPQNKEFRPLNIKECYNFYSCGDLTQAAGSTQNGEPNCKFFPACPQCQAYCIEIYPNNEEVDHLTIKIVVLEQLVPLMCIIKRDFPLATDLKAVLFQDSTHPIVTIAEQARNPDYNNIVEKLFDLKEFKEKLKQQELINNLNKQILLENLNSPLFKADSGIAKFFKGLKAALKQSPRHPWRKEITSQSQK